MRRLDEADDVQGVRDADKERLKAVVTRPTEKLAASAMAWNRMRLLVIAIRECRATLMCPLAKEGSNLCPWDDDADAPNAVYDALPDSPCWKREGNRDEDGRWVPHYTIWCPSCRLRQRIHEAYRACMQLRGARLRVMQQYARSAEREIDRSTV